MCSKIDFLSESEHMFNQLTKFKDGLTKSLNVFEKRENFIVDFIYKLSKEDDPLY